MDRMSSRPAREPHVHLGTRLLWVERIRRGEASCEVAAAELGVAVELVRGWLERHAHERPMSIDEIVTRPDVLRLTRRVERLAQLIALSESTLRTLNQLLTSGGPSKEEPQPPD
jgi:hypothetical protein